MAGYPAADQYAKQRRDDRADESVLDSTATKAFRWLRDAVMGESAEDAILGSLSPAALGVTTFADPLIRQLRSSHAIDAMQEATGNLGWAQSLRDAAGKMLGSKPRVAAHLEDVQAIPDRTIRGGSADAAAAGYRSTVPGRSAMYLSPEADLNTVAEELQHTAQRVGLKGAFDPLYHLANQFGPAMNPLEQSAKAGAANVAGAMAGRHAVGPTMGRALQALQDTFTGPGGIATARAAATAAPAGYSGTRTGAAEIARQLARR